MQTDGEFSVCRNPSSSEVIDIRQGTHLMPK